MDHKHSASSQPHRAVEMILLVLAGVFLALHFLHLHADFPNHSPWMDWAKYTDEGWYGDGAIRHFQRGHWYVPGDFNPAAALPVWPLVEAGVFRFTGVSLGAARGLTVVVFGLILVFSYVLMRRCHGLSTRRSGRSLAPAIAVVLLALSPFCYAFTRMAILEPLLVLLTLMALLAASFVRPEEVLEGAGGELLRGISRRTVCGTVARAFPLLALGLLLPLMVLTKTTAVFLMPGIGWMLWARAGYRIRAFLGVSLPVVALFAGVWLSYYGLIVRPHFLGDFHYLFSANAYSGITSDTAFSVLLATIVDGLWIGRILFPLALLAILSVFLLRPRLLRNPLLPSLLLWVAGYAAFLAYHNNLQPRYYLVIAVPLTLLVPLVFEAVWTPYAEGRSLTTMQRLGTVCMAFVLSFLAVTDARQTLGYVRSPEYSFSDAAARIHSLIAAEPGHSPLVLSISGSNLSLMTGIPSICDDFGTMNLTARVRAYRPGWYVTWNQIEDDKMDALAPMYHLERVAAFPVMDDPDRNLLILYRLDPAAAGTPLRPHRKRVVPRLLQTSFGQQPSPIQLVH